VATEMCTHWQIMTCWWIADQGPWILEGKSFEFC